MTYTFAQKVFEWLYDHEDTRKMAYKALRLIDISYESSLSAGEWIPCADPEVSEFNYWSKGHERSYPNEYGATRTWKWIQPKDEDYVYCFTETRGPIDNNTANKWELVTTISRKPLFLNAEALTFFNEYENLKELTLTQI